MMLLLNTSRVTVEVRADNDRTYYVHALSRKTLPPGVLPKDPLPAAIRILADGND